MDFIFELDWRLSISLTPKNIDWFVECVENLVNINFSNESVQKYKQTSLKITLLSIYRQNRKYDNFIKLSLDITNDNTYSNSLDLKRKFFYENALFQYSFMNIEKVESILCNWTISKSDYISVLWKSCIYAEIGKTTEAISLLNESLQDITTKLLVNNGSAALLSSYCIIDRMIHIYDPDKRLGYKSNNNEKYDLTSIFQTFRNDVAMNVTKKPVVHNHEFNIAKETTTFYIGRSGYNDTYVPAYRYLMCYEASGHTMGVPSLSISSNDFKVILPCFANFNFEHTISSLIRINQYEIVKETISRQLLKDVSTETANYIFDILHSKILRGLESKDKLIKDRAGNVIMPLLSRLSIKLSDKNIELLLNTFLKYFTSDDQYYKSENLETIYSSLSYDRLKENINKIYSTPINSLRFGKDIVLPAMCYSIPKITDGVICIIINGLKSQKTDIQNSAYIRCARIYNFLSEQQRHSIDNAIINWRNKSELTTNQLYSYNLLNGSSIESKKLDRIIAQDVGKVKTADVEYAGDSLTIQSLKSLIDRLIPIIHRMTESQIIDIFTKIDECLRINKEQFKKNDSSWFLGGLRRFVNGFLSSVRELIERIINNKNIQDRTIFFKLSEQLTDYDNAGYNVSSLKALCALLTDTDVKCLLESVEKKILSADNDIQQDAIDALTILSKTKIDIKTLLNKMIVGIQQTQNTSTSNYINLIIDVILQGEVKGDEYVQISSMLETIIRGIDQYPNTEEYKSDILFSSNILAGVLSILKADDEKLKSSIKLWNTFAEDTNQFNDVRRGFEIGVQIALRNKTIK